MRGLHAEQDFPCCIGGKVIRDGMGQSQVTNAAGAVDTVITSDIFTKEDAEILMRAGALPNERILGVETVAAFIERIGGLGRT